MSLNVSWSKEVDERKEALLGDLIPLLAIPSVNDPSTAGPGQPRGRDSASALDYMMKLAAKNGMAAASIEGIVGYVEYGASDAAAPAADDDYIAVLCHLDVVPATGEWTTPPFEPWIRDGKLYARGAIDDKGPAMAAFYALKIVKELGLPMKHKVRLIFGIDEETGMACMDVYNKREHPPLAGFAPDAVFPIVHAEKGQVNGRIARKAKEEAGSGDSVEEGLALMKMRSGTAANMVPDDARATVRGSEADLNRLSDAFQRYCEQCGLEGGALKTEGEDLELRLRGVSAHGMEPQRGVNAGLKLIRFLASQPMDEEARCFLDCCEVFFADDVLGEKLGIACSDEVTKELTLNVGVMGYERGKESYLQPNIRFPISANGEDIISVIADKVASYGFAWGNTVVKQPHHVPAEHPLIQTLQRIYEEETGLPPELLSTGGGTYACKLAFGVAFGALFPGSESTAHQPDEHVDIDELMKATVLYARAIYELANLDLERPARGERRHENVIRDDGGIKRYYSSFHLGRREIGRRYHWG